MSLIEVSWSPTDRQLRQFGGICLVALPFVAWLWGGDRSPVVIAGGAGLVLAVTGWIAPRILKPVFLALTLLTLPIGIVLGELILLAIFWGLFVPIGFAGRLLGRDPLQLKRDPDARTYWQPKRPPRNVASYYRQQ